MNFKKVVGLALTILALNLSVFSDVNAVTMSVKCEVTGASRSKIVVVGPGLVGNFWARATSGANVKSSRVKPTNASGLAVFNFDSNPAAIKAGATAIPATFIKGRTVTTYIRRAGTNALVAAFLATCTAK